PPEQLGKQQEIFDRVVRGEHISHFETVRQRKNGTSIDISLSLSPLNDQAGGTVGLAVIERDITDRKRLEAQLRQAQKMEAMGTLAGGIAHDFNNILNAIIGHSELLEEEVPAHSQAWVHLQEVLAAGARAKELVRQILTFSRQSEQERRPVVLQDIVGEAMRLLRASLPTTIEFRQQIEPGRALVFADTTQIHQILLNLCTNAEHAMRERGGLLDIQLKSVEVDEEFAADHPFLRPGSYVKLMVRDTGHGMTAQVRERIFDPFFTTKQPGEGTGMGLAVVHGIVVGHGGAITVESAPGRGTRFDVYLPRCDAAESLEIPLERPLRGQNEHILLVDDESSLVRLWTTMLEHLGYQVTPYSNSLQALESFRAAPQSFDLVISDQTMPQLTGEGLAREILRLRPNLPIILCTGFSHTLTEENAKTLGIRAILQKPLGRQELCVTVQRVLAERAAHSL
ncbi:MAG TPA: ATP-binding protein, partial [Candidatus Acidoferrum sp.]|nr:ATP-binding protein [Candidatus Acidoferrum sp.]